MRKKLIYSILKTIIMFLVLLNFGGVLSFFYPIPLGLAILSLSILFFILRKRFLIKKKYLYFLLIIYTILIVSIYINEVSFVNYRGIFMSLFSSVLILSSFESTKEVANYFIKACQIVMWLAFINFILTSLLPNLFVKAIANDSSYEVFTILYIFNDLGVPYQIAGINFFRNQGVFWEPGVLQVIMNILVYYYLFEEKKSLKHILLPIFILLTTASTTGLLLFAFLFTLKSIKEFDIKNFFIFVLVGISFVPILMNDIEYKFKGKGQQSSQLRTYDALMGIYIISKYPFTGIGIDDDKYKKETGLSFVEVDGQNLTIERGNTNSIILLCLYFGIPLAIIILYRVYHQRLFEKKWLFFIILIVCLMSEPLITRMFFYLLLMSSIKIKSSKLENNLSNSLIAK